ncbi:MAG: tyrosine-type recombinase/integrase [Pyrinomonadaceae bacterium]|nr:tyrosine-type recombinase/integrase [Pyrinomonadaceae bacterium]
MRTWKRVLGDKEIDKQSLKDFVIGMREANISPASCNVYIKAFNGYLIWLFENEYIPEPLHIKHLKAEKKIIKPFNDSQLKALITFKPKKFCEHRLHTLLLLLIDTGVRIDEALSLRRNDVDFDSLLVLVRGKGKKQRLIPFSLEFRKSLFKFLTKHSFDLVFCTRNGTRYSYVNCWRDFRILADKLGIEGVRVSPHTIRHTFARNYLREDGNVFYLSRALGHTNIQTTKQYIEVETEDLQEAHLKTSILSRLR